MTRAQELRKLLLEVEAGEWDKKLPSVLSARLVDILTRRTGNHLICQQILGLRRTRHIDIRERRMKIRRNHGTSKD